MKRYFPIALAAASIALAGSQAMAAEADMSKLTCKEVAAMPAAKTVGVAMWMNGYVHGKAGNAMVDGDVAQANAEKIADYCKSNPDATLASAIEAVAKS
jgi:acid stress chaperone HdeB